MTTHIAPNNPQYHVVGVFESLQGEDWNTGMPVVFIRLGKCNLACNWCDTDYLEFSMVNPSDVLGRLKIYTTRSIIITGGELIIQPHLDTLLNTPKAKGYFLCIRTSGLNPAPPQIDYVATSPKACYVVRYEKSCIEKANRVRIVADDEAIAFCQEVEREIRARHYYPSPCEQDGAMNTYNTIHQIGVLNSQADAPVHW